MLVCLYEDRLVQIPGLKLLLLSLREHCPSWPVQLRFPNAPNALKEWLQPLHQVRLSESPAAIAGSYNVKPEILLTGLTGLSSGSDRCLWLDTDVLVNGSLAFLEGGPPEELIVAADPWEYASGSTHRASSWGLVPSRDFPGPVNSCVVRVSAAHKELLEAWSRLAQRPDYLAGQAKAPERRNPHMLSDQDALSALIASDQFSSIPVKRLKHGSQIIQHHGAGAFGPKERFMVLRKGPPPLLHAMGTVKPWRMPRRVSPILRPREYYERVYLELSPYTHAARKYRLELAGEDDSWLDTQTAAGKAGTLLSMNRIALRGSLQAAVHRGFWVARCRLKARHSQSPSTSA